MAPASRLKLVEFTPALCLWPCHFLKRLRQCSQNVSKRDFMTGSSASLFALRFASVRFLVEVLYRPALLYEQPPVKKLGFTNDSPMIHLKSNLKCLGSLRSWHCWHRSLAFAKVFDSWPGDRHADFPGSSALGAASLAVPLLAPGGRGPHGMPWPKYAKIKCLQTSPNNLEVWRIFAATTD